MRRLPGMVRIIKTALTPLLLVFVMSLGAVAATPAVLSTPDAPTVEPAGNPGEIRISWDRIPGAQYYTVGWVDWTEAKPVLDAGGDWLSLFHYATVSGDVTGYTVKGLEGGDDYYGIMRATDAEDRFGGGYSPWSEWSSRPVQPVGRPGLTPPQGRYLGVGETIVSESGGFSFTLTNASTPSRVLLGCPDAPCQLASPSQGRRYVRVCGVFRHSSDGESALALGQDTVMNSDAGIGLSIKTTHGNIRAQTVRTGCETWEIPETAQTAIYTVNVVSFYSQIGSALRHEPVLGTYRIDLTGPSAKPTITFGDLNWSSAMVQTRIAQYIVEKGYGHPTDVHFGATSSLFDGLRGGDIDILMELWLPNQEEAWSAGLESGHVYSPGESLGKDWQSAFVIPAYVQEQYPDLDSVEDLKDPRYRELFATAETGGRARLVSCVAGWACEAVNAAQVAGYGLSDHVEIINPGDGSALNADLYGAYERREPWLGYQWGANDPALLLDLVRLEEPPYSDECWATTRACAYEDATILIAANQDLSESRPDVDEMLRNWDFPIDPVYRGIARWQGANPDADLDATALWWLKNHAGVWGQWVTDDAAGGIQAALASNERAAGWPD